MNHRFAYLLAAALALAAVSPGVMSATTTDRAEGDIDILVGGVAQRRYAHNGRLYVEALKGREYAIRIRNPYPVRVAVALAVDGLNTIDARQTTAAAARKWVIEPYGSVVISGWQTSRTEARRFEFTTEERSYGQSLGKTDNLGVISAVFFKERTATPMAEVARGTERQSAPVPRASAPADQRSKDAAGGSRAAENEYAATGMGRATDHAVTRVWLDLEDSPARTIDIRYEFRPQLIKLGILPAPHTTDRLERRERARGFEPGFCPEPRRR